VSRNKAKGTSVESALVKYAAPIFNPFVVERRALAGSADQGDVWIGNGRVIIEAKTRNHAHSHLEASRWLAEAEREAINADAAGAKVDACYVVVKPPGVGLARVADWWLLGSPADVSWLLCGVQIADGGAVVQMRVGDALPRLRQRLVTG
jgi:hypothetical protein